jgi:hypothetical protein
MLVLEKRREGSYAYYSGGGGGTLHLFIGVRSLPLLWYDDLPIFKFMIMLASCFMVGNAPLWGHSQNVGPD